MSLFEPLFKGVSTGFWRRFIEKYFKNTLRTFRSAIENLRLGTVNLQRKQHRVHYIASDHMTRFVNRLNLSVLQRRTASRQIHRMRLSFVIMFANFMLPKRRFWRPEQSVACAFLNEFSMMSSPNRVLTSLKSTSKTHTKVLRKDSSSVSFSHRNSSLGEA